MAYVPLLRYIDSLTDEERERYRPIIDDSLRRDKMLAESYAEARRRAERCAESLVLLGETAERLHAGIASLNGKLAEVLEVSRPAATHPEPGDEAGMFGWVSTSRH
jgi:hypothetical protein